jgi:hypothetical protein
MNLLSDYSEFFGFPNDANFVENVYYDMEPAINEITALIDQGSLDISTLNLRTKMRTCLEVFRALVAVLRDTHIYLDDVDDYLYDEYEYMPGVDDYLFDLDSIIDEFESPEGNPTILETKVWIHRYVELLNENIDLIHSWPEEQLDEDSQVMFHRARSLYLFEDRTCNVIGPIRSFEILESITEQYYRRNNFALMYSRAWSVCRERVIEGGTQDVDRGPIEVASSLASNPMRKCLEFIGPM